MESKTQSRSTIPISTDIRSFYKQYLNIIRPLLEPHLSNGELNVLGELLYLNYKYRSLDKKARGIIIFDYENKVAIMEELGSSMSTIVNAISSLRKKKYIIGNTLKEAIVVYPGENYSLTYQFEINGVDTK
jgi:hypothetical protein